VWTIVFPMFCFIVVEIEIYVLVCSSRQVNRRIGVYYTYIIIVLYMFGYGDY
jgi:hypothetical protein